MKLNFLESRKDNKEIKKDIKDISNNFSFMIKWLKDRGGLERSGDHYGDFLNNLSQDKFILIKQSMGVILESTEKILKSDKNISEPVKKNLLKLKDICENIKNVEWEPYQVGNYQDNDFNKKETLTNKGGKNQKISELLFDIYAPIANLESAKFQSIFDSKIEPDRYHL
jgi:hypothetical protein